MNPSATPPSPKGRPGEARHDNTLGRPHRLKSRQLTELLFADQKHKSLTVFPLRMVILPTPRREGCGETQLLVSVPKRKLRHAVDRNRVKRLVRESWRHNRHALDSWTETHGGEMLAVALVWMESRVPTAGEVDHKVKTLLRRLAPQL